MNASVVYVAGIVSFTYLVANDYVWQPLVVLAVTVIMVVIVNPLTLSSKP